MRKWVRTCNMDCYCLAYLGHHVPVCLTLCLYLIKDTDISLTIGVIATLLMLLGIAKIFQSKKEKQEKLPKEIVRYSENYLRSRINDALQKDVK